MLLSRLFHSQINTALHEIFMLAPIKFTEDEVASALSLWSKCHAFLVSLLDETAVKNWINPIEPCGIKGEELTLRVPTEHFAIYLEENFAREFNLMLQSYVGANAILIFEYRSQTASLPETPASKQEEMPARKAENYVSFLNDALRFETFYESECNRVARMIAQGVAERPGQAPLNLLFIYGPSGVGKTHLSQAIGQKVQELHPSMRVCYVSSAKFEAQYVHDARFRERGSFIEFYQQMDVLIIDDIQGLVGKEKTQQAFFEIFNHLYLLNKQIVLTADIPPVEFRGIENRIFTRIQSSVMIPLERPDIELRRKILRSKVAESGVQLGDEIVEFIAENMQNNVRELDGAIKTLVIRAQMSQREINMSDARQVVCTSINMEKPEITMDRIQQIVAQEYNIEVAQLRSSTRRADIALPRQIVMYMTKKHTDHSYNAIAERLGRKNHTTVMHGVKAVGDRMSVDEGFRQTMTQLESLLTQPAL